MLFLFDFRSDSQDSEDRLSSVLVFISAPTLPSVQHGVPLCETFYLLSASPFCSGLQPSDVPLPVLLQPDLLRPGQDPHRPVVRLQKPTGFYVQPGPDVGLV